MASSLQWTRSLVFVVQMYLAMLVAGIAFAPLVLAGPAAVRACARLYARYVIWSARVICGLAIELRGEVPEGGVLVASKHQSFLDVLVLLAVLPRARFVLKESLLRLPIFGWYARRLGCIAVNREDGGKAMMAMIAAVRRSDDADGQLVIYPQGTRVAPGASAPYKPGAALLYAKLGRPCVPVATNAGLFWPRRGLLRQRGVAVFEFLPTIAPGMAMKPFLHHLEAQIEPVSDGLLREGLAARHAAR